MVREVERGSAARRVRARLTEIELDGEAGIYHPGTDRVVMLNGPATAVWRLVDGTRSDAAIAAEVAARYGIDDETAREGVAVALDHLLAERLVERSGRASGETSNPTSADGSSVATDETSGT